MRTLWSTATYSFMFSILFLLSACNPGAKKKFGEPPNFQITSEVEIDFLTVRYFSLPSCIRCHAGVQSPDLSTYEALISEIDEVQYTILDGEMPPSGDVFDQLSNCQKLVLDTWVSRGMPAKGGASLGAPGNACY